jgi:hypothetical protein
MSKFKVGDKVSLCGLERHVAETGTGKIDESLLTQVESPAGIPIPLTDFELAFALFATNPEIGRLVYRVGENRPGSDDVALAKKMFDRNELGLATKATVMAKDALEYMAHNYGRHK